MANPILIKRSSVAAKIPLTTDLQLGELAINTNDGKLFLKKNNGTDSIVEVGAVTTVAGRTGAVVLSTSDVSEGTNLYYTNSRAQAAISVSGTGLSYAGGVITSNATPNNTSNAIMSRDASGSFSAGTANLAGSLYTTNVVALNGATGSYSGFASGVTLNYTGNNSQYGMSLKPSSSTADTSAISFLSSSSTYASGISLGAIQHLANDAGMNLAGTWNINGAPIASTTGNVATATKLATARTIAGVSFDGTANITLTTANITEGSNLYFTSARAQAAISVSGVGLSYANGVISSNATSSNTASAIVARDASGNFSAGTISATALSTTSTVTANSTVTAANGTTGQVIVGGDANGAIELGQAGRSTSGTPFIDFHSSVGSGDYDVRLVASGGSSASTGQGTLNIVAGSVTINAAPVPTVNPSAPKDGDVQVAAGPIISIYASGAWRQIFPAVYA